MSIPVETGYAVDLEELCKTQRFTPEQVEKAELVYPKGAVMNSQLLWIRVTRTGGDVAHLTLPLSEFHRYVNLPVSTLGGVLDYGS